MKCFSDYRKSLLPQRFWAKVEKSDGCWLWKANTADNGYGRFWWEGRNHPAHRLAWELTYGPRPAHLIVCHHCDSHACVRPEHLFLGTNKTNSEDMVKKGRQSQGTRHTQALKPSRKHGSNHPNARFTEADVIEMRRLYDSGEASQHAIARQFNTTQPQVQAIVSRKSWRHL